MTTKAPDTQTTRAPTVTSGFDAVIEAILRTPGATRPSLRADVLQWAAGEQSRPDLSEALSAYLEKVVEHAYRVTDEDMRLLYEEGLGNAEIFELTAAAAIGAGERRARKGLTALALHG